MSAAQNLIAALDEKAAAAAGAPVSLLSVTLDVVGEGAPAETHVEIVRTTKSLVFSIAEARDAAGAPVITASGVHKITR